MPDPAFCDLHAHSTASDGTTPPEDLAHLARDAGLAAVALTDHDTTAGLEACAAACRELGVAFVPGIELSADPGYPGLRPQLAPLPALEDADAPPAASAAPDDPDFDGVADAPHQGTLHILGLFVRHDDPTLREAAGVLLEARTQRNPQIVGNLQRLGVPITYEEVLDAARQSGGDGRVVGRPHIGQVMVRKGYAKSIQDAFARYIGEGRPAYVRKDRLSPRVAIDAIHHAGGLAILAHPTQLRLPDLAHLEHMVVKLRGLGLDGIETRHSDHTAADAERFEKLAARLGLLTSGGSDFHGTRKPLALGSQRVPAEVYERLRAAWVERTAAATR